MKQNIIFQKRIHLPLLFLLIIFSYCSTQNSKESRERVIELRFEEKRNLMLDSYQNKKLSFLPTITKDSIRTLNNKYFLFYYNSNDCYSCINDGLEICKDIDLELDENCFTIISTGAKDKYPYSFVDRKKEIQTKLVSIYSPIFFILNDQFEIIDLVICDSKIKDNKKVVKDFLYSYL
jgi:hypothetical protein